MAGTTTYTMTVKSNDGSKTLYSGLFTQSQAVAINDTGFSANQINFSMVLTGYSGFATSPNASSPSYSIGQNVNVSATNTTWYLVGTPSGGGSDPTLAGLTIKYDGSTIFSNDNITANIVKTLQCSGKLMNGNVEVDVTPGSGGGTVQITSGSFTGFGNVDCGFKPDIVLILCTSSEVATYTEQDWGTCASTWCLDFREYSDALPVMYWGNYPGVYGTMFMEGHQANNGFRISWVDQNYGAVPSTDFSQATYNYIAFKGV